MGGENSVFKFWMVCAAGDELVLWKLLGQPLQDKERQPVLRLASENEDEGGHRFRSIEVRLRYLVCWRLAARGRCSLGGCGMQSARRSGRDFRPEVVLASSQYNTPRKVCKGLSRSQIISYRLT
jgi:hypothetical protein